MACTCSTCARWTLAITSALFFVLSIFMIIGVSNSKNNQKWFKPIRDNSIVYYLSMTAVAFVTIYSIFGLFVGGFKKPFLYIIFFIIMLLVILLKVSIILLTLYYKEEIFQIIGEKWNEPRYRQSRYNFEKNFKCCGFLSYNKGDECAVASESVVLCGVTVKVKLYQYLDQLRSLSVLLLFFDILPTILAMVLSCCNQDDEDVENKDLESTQSLFISLIN